MLLGINVPEKEYKMMSDAEKLALLDEAYRRTRQMKFRAFNAQKKLDILRIPMEYAYQILTEKEVHMVHALRLGYFN